MVVFVGDLVLTTEGAAGDIEGGGSTGHSQEEAVHDSSNSGGNSGGCDSGSGSTSSGGGGCGSSGAVRVLTAAELASLGREERRQLLRRVVIPLFGSRVEYADNSSGRYVTCPQLSPVCCPLPSPVACSPVCWSVLVLVLTTKLCRLK